MHVNGHSVAPYRVLRTIVGTFLVAVVAPFVIDCGLTEQGLFIGAGILLIDYKLFLVMRTGKANE